MIFGIPTAPDTNVPRFLGSKWLDTIMKIRINVPKCTSYSVYISIDFLVLHKVWLKKQQRWLTMSTHIHVISICTPKSAVSLYYLHSGYKGWKVRSKENHLISHTIHYKNYIWIVFLKIRQSTVGAFVWQMKKKLRFFPQNSRQSIQTPTVHSKKSKQYVNKQTSLAL